MHNKHMHSWIFKKKFVALYSSAVKKNKRLMQKNVHNIQYFLPSLLTKPFFDIAFLNP